MAAIASSDPTRRRRGLPPSSRSARQSGARLTATTGAARAGLMSRRSRPVSIAVPECDFEAARRTAPILVRRARRSAPIRRGLPSAWSIGRAVAPDRVFVAERDAAGDVARASPMREALARCARDRRGAAGARAVRRAAGRDPVGQRRRACAARAGRAACRRPLCADLAGVFAALERLRQAAPYRRRC